MARRSGAAVGRRLHPGGDDDEDGGRGLQAGQEARQAADRRGLGPARPLPQELVARSAARARARSTRGSTRAVRVPEPRRRAVGHDRLRVPRRRAAARGGPDRLEAVGLRARAVRDRPRGRRAAPHAARLRARARLGLGRRRAARLVVRRRTGGLRRRDSPSTAARSRCCAASSATSSTKRSSSTWTPATASPTPTPVNWVGPLGGRAPRRLHGIPLPMAPNGRAKS